MRRLKVGDLCLELSEAQVEELREQLEIDVLAPATPLNVKAVATRIGRSTDYVYDHAAELGGRKVGGVWLFDIDRLHRGNEGEASAKAPMAPPRRRQPRQRGSSTLAVRGSKPV
jgi:hypothetical protein